MKGRFWPEACRMSSGPDFLIAAGRGEKDQPALKLPGAER